MKLRASLVVMLVLVCSLRAQPAPGHRTRVALALSGGGSLGLAHIGVLQYFEDHHIPVDAIAGTSMGAIVGGLYATGHSPAQIEASFSEAGWSELLRSQPRYDELPVQSRQDRVHYPGDYALRLGQSLTLPAGLSTAEPLDLFLSRQVLAYSTVEDFAQLPTAFRCVATQLETGEPFVLRHGNLARALRATMSVPGIFTPVVWEGHVLVDGGLVDNLPTDVARDMGADVVIAVHFNLPVPPARQLQSLPNVLTQAVSVAVSITERENLRNADLVLAPSLVGIGGIDYTHAAELIQRGYQAAAQKQRFLATLALSDADWEVYQAERRSRMKAPPPQAAGIVAVSSDPALADHAQNLLTRSISEPLSLYRLDHELSALVTSAALPGAFYRMSAEQPNKLIAELEPRSGNQTIVRPSLELAIANGEPTRGALRGFSVLLPPDTFRASYRVQFAAGYSPMIAAEYDRSIDASQWFWASAINLSRLNSATYNGSQHFSHWQDTYSAGFDLGYGLRQRFRLRAGFSAGFEHLSDRQLLGARIDGNGGYIAPRLQAEWNSLDEPALPTRGILFSGSMAARYRQWNGRTVPLGQAGFAQNMPLFSGTVTLSANAASSFGVAVNYYDLFPLGGPTDLRAFRYQQFHTTSYALGGVAYRRPIVKTKLFGERPQLGAWYQAAGLSQLGQTWQSAQSGSLGVLLNSPLGVVTFAVGRTSDHQTRAWINVGRP